MQPIVGGKPMQLTGKPLLQLGGKGGQPLSVIQTSQGQISTLSLIPQALPTTAHVSSVVSSAVTGSTAKVAVAANCTWVFGGTLVRVWCGIFNVYFCLFCWHEKE